MKKGYILWLLISVISLPVVAQNIIYSNLKELLAQASCIAFTLGTSSLVMACSHSSKVPYRSIARALK